MDQYKEMYYKLFRKLCDIAEEIKQVQLETEEMYLMQQEEAEEEEP